MAGSGGEPEVLIALNERELGQFPQALPGGDAILFTLRASSSTPWEQAQIVVQYRFGRRMVSASSFGQTEMGEACSGNVPMVPGPWNV